MNKLSAILVIVAILAQAAIVGYVSTPSAEASPAPVTSCWFQPVDGWTFEGWCGPSSERPSGAFDTLALDVTDLPPATVDAWLAQGAYSDDEDRCECLYVPVAPVFGNVTRSA